MLLGSVNYIHVQPHITIIKYVYEYIIDLYDNVQYIETMEAVLNIYMHYVIVNMHYNTLLLSSEEKTSSPIHPLIIVDNIHVFHYFSCHL